MDEPIRLVIVDDHSIVRHGLRAILQLEPGLLIVGEANDTRSALQVIAAHRPHIVLLDLSLSGGTADGLALCRTISARFPDSSVIILTTFLDERLVLEAIQSGAKGYVLKDVDATDLIKSVRAVRRGESALDTRPAALVMRHLGGPAPAPESDALSARELAIVRLIARGLSNRLIGEQLAISESTVKFYLRSVMRKLAVSHRTEVVYAALKRGLL